MALKNRDLIGFITGITIVALAYYFVNPKYFSLAIIVGILIGVLPTVIKAIRGSREALEKEYMFLEFSRNLVESVKTGTPINKSLVNVANKNYGVLSPHIKKLANQISIGIPLNKALKVFSKDANNSSISRSLTLIGQAERAGGEIGEILEAVAQAVSMTDKLKKERRAAISTLVSQGYIIFLVFIVIILVLQFQIVPMVSGIGNLGGTLGFGGTGGFQEISIDTAQIEISNAFLYLILTQGLFTGLIIGKLSEGNLKSGIKHSFSLMFLSFIISTIATIFFM